MSAFPSLNIRDILLMTIGTLAALVVLLAGEGVFTQIQSRNEVRQLRTATLLGDVMFEAGESITVERHVTSSLLHAENAETATALMTRMRESRKQTDEILERSLHAVEKYGFGRLESGLADIKRHLLLLRQLRNEVDAMRAQPLPERRMAVSAEWSGFSTGLIMEVQSLWLNFIGHFIEINPVVNVQMRFKYFLWTIMEYSGRARSLIGELIARQRPPAPQERAELLRWQGIVEMSWNIIHTLVGQSRIYAALMPHLEDAESDYQNIYAMTRDAFYLPTDGANEAPYPIGADLWLELATQANDSLYRLKNVSLKEMGEYMAGLEKRAQEAIVAHSIILLLTILLSIYSFYVVNRRVLHPIRTMADALVSATEGGSFSPALLQVRQKDEIGKLARVLAASQKNAEAIKRYSAMLEKYVADLKRSNQELDDFAYIASHDLKEPLRGLLTQCTFLLEDYQEKLDVEGIRRLRRIMYLSQRMELLINDLLTFSRLGRTELAVQETDLNEVVGEIRQMMDTFLKERNAKIVIPQPMPKIVCDKPKIAEVFRNLITNAVKYNDKPERVVEVGHLENVAAPHGEEKLVFYVRDNGVGIPPEYHDAIFRIFKRLENPALKDEGGTGAGLTFVKKIIDRHKGRIWLDSVPGQGSTFFFTIGSKET